MVRCFDAKSAALKATLKGHTVAVNALQVTSARACALRISVSFIS